MGMAQSGKKAAMPASSSDARVIHGFQRLVQQLETYDQNVPGQPSIKEAWIPSRSLEDTIVKLAEPTIHGTQQGRKPVALGSSKVHYGGLERSGLPSLSLCPFPPLSFCS